MKPERGSFITFRSRLVLLRNSEQIQHEGTSMSRLPKENHPKMVCLLFFGIPLCFLTKVSKRTVMSRPVFWWSLVLCALSTAAASEEDVPPATAQEALGLLASLQQGNEGSNDFRKMANMYELLQLAALQQQQQRQRLAELEEQDREEREELPVALPLQTKMATLQDSSEYWKDKRGSYMSLCHFKICNMGRKRSSLWNTWSRN